MTEDISGIRVSGLQNDTDCLPQGGAPPYIGWAQTIAGVGEDPSRELQKSEAKVFGIFDVDIQVKDTSKGQSYLRYFYLYIITSSCLVTIAIVQQWGGLIAIHC